MLSFLFSGVMKWVSGGLLVAIIAGSLILWHRMEYVPRAELNQWKDYAANLQKAYQKREAIIKKYEEEKVLDDAVIEQMEKDLNDLLIEESKGDDSVVLDRDDVERLRDFLNKR